MGRASPGRGRQCGQWSMAGGSQMRTHLALKEWARPAAGTGLPSASPYGVGVGESRSADGTQPPGRPGWACLRRAPTALESGSLLRSMGPGPPSFGAGRRTAPSTAAPNPPPALRLVPRPCKGRIYLGIQDHLHDARPPPCKGRIKTRELGPSFSGTAICCVY